MTKNIEQTALSLIGPIYEASHDITMWPAAITMISDALKSLGGILFYENLVTKDLRFCQSGRLDERGLPDYLSYYMHVDCRLEAILANPIGSVQTDDSLMPREVYYRSEVYQDFLLKWEAGRVLGSQLMWSPSESCFLGIQKSIREPPYSDEDIALGEIIMPHVKNAIRVYQKLHGATVQQACLWEYLNTLDTAVILINDTGYALFVNNEAQRILAIDDGLVYDRKNLTCSLNDDVARLRKLIRDVCAMAAGTRIMTENVVAVKRASGRRPFIVTVYPLPIERYIKGQAIPVAAITIIDPERRVKLRPAVLKKLWKLTGREIELIELLIEGCDRDMCADRLGVSHNTVKTHLKNCFGKTDTHSVTELIGLILKSGLQAMMDASA